MNTKTVLVTGGAGYIGSHACKALAEAGYQPVVFDNLSTGSKNAVQFGPLVEGDIRDAAALKNVLEQYQPVAVMHFAALIKAGESVAEPADYYHVNTFGAWTLLNAIRATQIVPVVFSSSAAVYGIPASSPVTEDATLSPINPYGQSKLMVERMLTDYAHAYGLPSVSLRYFNAAGASLDNSLGLTNRTPSSLIPMVLETVMGTRPAMEIYGTDYPTPDGTGVRDYIHVADLATAHVAALQYLLRGGETTAINLGTGAGISVQEILTSMTNLTGKPITVNPKPRRPGDPPAVVADASRARAVLNWLPEHSDVGTILKTAYNWRQTLPN